MNNFGKSQKNYNMNKNEIHQIVLADENKPYNYYYNPDLNHIERMTILDTMYAIAWGMDGVKKKNFFDDYFEKVKYYSSHLADILKVTPTQAVIFSLFVDRSYSDQIRLRSLFPEECSHMTKLVLFEDDVEDLQNRRFIRCSGNYCGEYEYEVTKDCLAALRRNEVYVPKKHYNLTFAEMMHLIFEIVIDANDGKSTFKLLFEDLCDLVFDNPHLKFSRVLIDLHKGKKLKDYEWVLLVMLADDKNNFFDNGCSLSGFTKMLPWLYDGFFKDEIVRNSNSLQTMGLVEYVCSDGMVDTDILQLSVKATKMLLSEAKKKFVASNHTTLDYHSITTKKLFFDPHVGTQVGELRELLAEEKMKQICERLHEKGMRKGFICLFYGAPGTGKTETVLQLARKTGRNIIQVDMSTMRDKYVGESEKQVAAVFERYRVALKEEKIAPILLFNEADAIIGKRFENVEHSVAKMENAMQNILLQEMENFEGILIATTNLQGNLDAAFERRFLYKVCFDKPSAYVRRQIWKGIIPSVTEETAYRLAKEFDFSGGQIENIARKYTVNEILYGAPSKLYITLRNLCLQESIQNHSVRPSIGFVA